MQVKSGFRYDVAWFVIAVVEVATASEPKRCSKAGNQVAGDDAYFDLWERGKKRFLLQFMS